MKQKIRENTMVVAILIVVLLTVITFAFTACASGPSINDTLAMPVQIVETGSGPVVDKYIDWDMNVVCYIYGSNIDCMEIP